MWTIEFHEKAVDEIGELPLSLQKAFSRVFDLISENGLFTLPHKYSKHIEGNIWELRVIGIDGIARSLYVTKEKQTVKILVAFHKKTQKTPREKIDLAKKRSEE